MSKNDGGPAFPLLSEWHQGMPLRDYFAAAALQGFCANNQSLKWEPDECAADAYQFADAMLAERDK